MYDSYNRAIDYLRISVTDKCNLRCTYCMPAEGVSFLPHDKILRLEEILEFTRVAVNMGVRKVRLTGGEPLVRRNIIWLIEKLAGISEIQDLSITTNGILLSEYALALVKAGLHRVNISLDTIDPVRFREITRGGVIYDVFNGIDAALKAGLNPIKINCVIQKSANEPEAIAVADYCKRKNLELRYIRVMNLAKGEYHTVEGGSGGDCTRCNRLRLTSDGFLKPCLFNELKINIREISYADAIRTALKQKPICGSNDKINSFHSIGG
jgi:GTP 3',8-cyclase